MITLVRLGYFDLHFLGVPRIIATVVAARAGGAALIDPGPSSTLPALRAALRRARASRVGRSARDPADAHPSRSRRRDRHAASARIRRCASTCTRRARRTWSIRQKLIASATRLWGDEMDRLWGEVRPVPAARAGRAAGRRTHHRRRPRPRGRLHARARVASRQLLQRRHRDRVRRRHRRHPAQPGGFILPPTPPPDIDLEAWRESLARIADWRPDTLFVTHFGPYAPVGAHLTEMARPPRV